MRYMEEASINHWDDPIKINQEFEMKICHFKRQVFFLYLNVIRTLQSCSDWKENGG